MINLAEALRSLFPDIIFDGPDGPGDCRLENLDDGAGPRIVRWGRPEPLPTAAALAAAAVIEPVPATVSRTQMRRWLLRHKGLVEATILALIEAIPDPVQREEARIGWESSVISRANPLVSALGAGLGMSEAEIDQAFREAAAITE